MNPSSPIDAARQKEALRQQTLLRALLGDARPAVVGGWMREQATAPERFTRGIKAYQANAGALAERAFAAAFPVLQALMGEPSFAAMARVYWRQQPPLRGDMALWGEGLPAFIESADQLADEPYLADVARLEWALHAAASAADAPAGVQGLALLGQAEPEQLCLVFVPGTALVRSHHPVASIWLAHQPEAGGGDERFAAVRQAFAAGRGEAALVCREGFKPVVHRLADGEAAFVQALLEGQSLGEALSRNVVEIDFSTWLVRALERRWIAEVAHTGDR